MNSNIKNFQSGNQPSSVGGNFKVQNGPSSQLRLRYTTTKFTQSKRYNLPKPHTNAVSSLNQYTKSTFNQLPLSQSNFFGRSISNLTQSYDQGNTQPDISTKNQTFKDFIQKIQIYNQNSLIKQHPNLIQLQTRKTQPLKLQKQQVKNNFLNVNLKNSFQSDKIQPESSIYIDNKTQNSTQNNQKYRNFVIHDTMGKGFLARGYRRSRTQQQIKIKKTDLPQNRKSMQIHQKKDSILETSIFQRTISKFKMSSDLSRSPLKYIDIKLVGREILSEQVSKQSLQHTISQEHADREVKSSQKEEQILKRTVETNHSKIRIRLGTSLYHRNLWTRQSPNNPSKENLKIESKNILVDLGTIHNKKNHKTICLNSQFCQNKIIEAQNNFIQKRRLLPTGDAKSGEDSTRIKKQFFSIQNPIIRQKRVEKSEIDDVNKSPLKGENLNGWEMNEDSGYQNKIQELF